MINLSQIRNGLSRSFGRSTLILRKYSPELLLGAGLIGVVAAAVLAAKATLKAEEIVLDTKSKLASIDDTYETIDAIPEKVTYTDEDVMKAKALVYVQSGLKFTQLYGPSVGLGMVSIVAILASHGIMSNRQVSLIAAYNLLNEGFQSYRKRVVDELGEDVDKNYYLGLKDENRTETVLDADGNKTKVKSVVKGTYDKGMNIYSRFFDESNPNYSSDRSLNKAFLLAKQNYLNDVLIIRGHVFLNEVYEDLGFPHTKEGSIVGWVLRSAKQMKEELRDGYIDFGIFDVYNDPAREFVNGTNPSILLNFNVDGIIYNLI